MEAESKPSTEERFDTDLINLLFIQTPLTFLLLALANSNFT